MEVPYHLRPYRKNVAAVVLNEQGQILACKRKDFNQSWQIPQGGIDEGESEFDAVIRELQEEIGTTQVELIGRLDENIRYDWPEAVAHKHYKGQEQTYFLFRLSPSAVIDFQAHPPAEFEQYEWLGAKDFLSRIDRSPSGGFKVKAYETAIALFQKMYPGVLAE